MKLHGAVLLGGILLGGVLIAQVPLWIAGRVFHWRLVSWAVGADRPGQSHLQFQLKHVLLATALVSVALAPARVVLPPGDINNLSLDRELPVLLVAVTVCNLVITVPCIWGAFVNKALLFRLALGWLAYCAVLSAVELVALVAILGAPGGHEIEMLLTFVILNVSQCATVFGTLLVFRVLGFRLIRTAGAGESAAEGDSPFRERDHGH